MPRPRPAAGTRPSAFSTASSLPPGSSGLSRASPATTSGKVLNAIVARGSPSAANHALATVRKMFNWAIEQGHVDRSPCFGVKAPSKNKSRDHVLTMDELVRIWLAAETMGWPYGRIVQLLILTGQRRNEVTGMRWCELDLGQGPVDHPCRTGRSLAARTSCRLCRPLSTSSRTSPRFTTNTFSRPGARTIPPLASRSGSMSSMASLASAIGASTI